MRIDLVQAPSGLRDMLCFTLEVTFGIKVNEFDKIEALIAFTESTKDTRAIKIIDSHEPSPDLQALVKVSQGSPIVLIHDNPKLRLPNIKGGVTIVDRSKLPDELMAAIHGIIVQGSMPAPVTAEKLTRIRTNLLLDMEKLHGDLYIRLSESKFIKVIKSDDRFDQVDFKKYKEKGIDYLYIRNLDCEKFLFQYRKAIADLLKAAPANFETVSRTAESVHEMVRVLSRSLGFSQPVQDLVKVQVMASVKLIQKNKKLSTVLKKIDQLPAKYISSHSHLTAFIACGIASQMQWGSESTFLKLNLASFLHDIPLENEELAAETSLEEVERSPKYTPAEKSAFRTHPIDAAEIAKKFTEIPPDVDTIIVQHHELPDGKGFPRGTTSVFLSPLTTVFIVAHDMARELLKTQGEFDHARFIEEMGQRYKSAAFKQVLNVIENMRYHVKK